MNWKQLTLVPPLVLLGACGIDAPMAPELAAEPDMAVQANTVAALPTEKALPTEEAASLLAALEDVRTRLLPALAESQRALAALRAHPDARQAPAELDAVQLVLNGIPEFHN